MENFMELWQKKVEKIKILLFPYLIGNFHSYGGLWIRENINIFGIIIFSTLVSSHNKTLSVGVFLYHGGTIKNRVTSRLEAPK